MIIVIKDLKEIKDSDEILSFEETQRVGFSASELFRENKRLVYVNGSKIFNDLLEFIKSEY